jgi:hypothetical protein
VKLLEKIDSIDFSDAEKDRIAKSLLDIQSSQYRVLTSKAPAIHDNDFWRRAQRAFGVTGFRDGHPKAIQMVMTRVLDPKKSHAGWHLIWPLYLRSVLLYVHDELTELHALLKREDFQASPGTLTEQILRCVVKCLPLYEGTVDQVRELYELWGFERTKYIDEILGNATVEADAVRRMIDDGVGTMRREITSAIASTRIDILKHVEHQATEVISLKQLLQKARTELDDAVAKIQTMNNAAGAQIKAPDPVLASMNPRVQAPVQVTLKPQGSDRALAAIEILSTRVEALGHQLKELRNRIKGLETEHSPIMTVTAVQASTTTALQVINKWSQGFEEAGVPNASLGASWILLEVVRRSRIILTDEPQLFLGLFGSLPASESRCVVASPLWITETDWKDALSFIADDSGAPRMLVVVDFDVGLQDTYLVPSLTGWISAIKPQNSNRIVLVPSDSDFGSVSARVFELATLATHDAPYIRDIKRLGATIVDPPPTLELPQSATTIVGYARSKNVSHEDDLRRYAANYGVSIPPRVLENYVSMREGMRASLGVRDADYVAQQASLIPWVEQARGEAVSRTLQEALKTVLGDD